MREPRHKGELFHDYTTNTQSHEEHGWTYYSTVYELAEATTTNWR